MKLVKFLVYYILGFFGIAAVSNSPLLFEGKGILGVPKFLSETINLLKDLVSPEKWIIYFHDKPEHILTAVKEPYFYSMKILLGGILLGFLVAFILAILTIFLPKPILSFIRRVLNIFESVPDLMLAFLFQILVVYIYKKTDFLLMPVTSITEDIYLAPITVLAIVPMISLYKVIVLLVEEEMTKDYVEFAQAKGIKRNVIVLFHVLRNVVKSSFYHTKIIVWASLSSLFIIEYIFNIQGVTNYIIQDFRPMVIAVILLLIFTPFYVLYQGTEFLVMKEAQESEVLKFNRRTWKERWASIRSWVIWRVLSRSLKEFGIHLKNPKFLIGFLIIFGMFAYSIYYSVSTDNLISKHTFVYDDNGKLLSAPPNPPSKDIPLGTDRLGFSILDQLVVGAKWTIVFATLIAFLRVFLGFLLAIPYAMFIKDRWRRGIEKFVDSFHFLPITIIAFILLRPILWKGPGGFTYDLTERIGLEIILLTILVVPLVMVLIGNELKLLMKNEFITSAKVLGGGTRHILFRQLLPHMISRLGIVFGQQFIQVLVVFIHLGLFQLFFGGTVVSYALVKDPPRSFTYEWSGMIGDAKSAFMTGDYWIVVPALVAFMIVIICMQFVIEGIKEVQQERVGVYVERSWITRKIQARLRARKQQKSENTTSIDFHPDHFKRVDRSL
ncbi:ABC transporter permease subunit [Radiobacillus kanasensis]|uniref:ABC transporter permease subunit n=1 Tax=Radiobacillus kanasensis TaxID=2844358 RepID=UPI001E5EEDFA|nr:ABC transporter permease subunit [Radiobacillus kanasensis]UFT98987.1 ABC transporter permease subunit [Radiobacillus kanasensis]